MDPLNLAISLLLLFLPPAGVQEEDAIRWDGDYRLTWEDFRAAPPESLRVAATTASGISYSYRTRGHSGNYRLDYEVSAYFYPDKSWYHPELCDSVVLSHEQLHFDISELYARKMRGLLEGKTYGSNVRAEVRQLFSRINQELSEFQDRYDRETYYSRDREAQARWNRWIAGQLHGRGS